MSYNTIYITVQHSIVLFCSVPPTQHIVLHAAARYSTVNAGQNERLVVYCTYSTVQSVQYSSTVLGRTVKELQYLARYNKLQYCVVSYVLALTVHHRFVLSGTAFADESLASITTSATSPAKSTSPLGSPCVASSKHGCVNTVLAACSNSQSIAQYNMKNSTASHTSARSECSTAHTVL